MQLTRPHAPSSGLLLLDKPLKLTMENNVGQPVSFSTEFSFSIAPGNCDGLAFVLIPNGFHTRFQGQGSLVFLVKIYSLVLNLIQRKMMIKLETLIQIM